MNLYIILSIIGFFLMLFAGFFFGMKAKKETPEDSDYVRSLLKRVEELSEDNKAKEDALKGLNDKMLSLTSERDVQASRAANLEKEISELKATYKEEKAELKAEGENRIEEIRKNYELELDKIQRNFNIQLEGIKELNSAQVENLRQQLQTSSEEILKRRQAELGERNKEQVTTIIDPLLKSLNDMKAAFDLSKEQQKEALTRLDATIKINTDKSRELGETADRLARALTGEVKAQGNFGELKLRQLLEDMELKEGEQYETQKSIKDRFGRAAESDEGKGLIPDFILHFPNNRYVVVDSKMSLTAFERYMNSEEGSAEKSAELRSHIASVRTQVKRLASKAYSKYLPEGYNRLDFAFMYIPVEGALNLALLNDTSLWREAYDQGVIILGPQTMYMNLRVLEMMWTQIRQLKNQQAMMKAANTLVDRVQDLGLRFSDIDSAARNTLEKINSFKITIAPTGKSIITAAKSLLKSGAKENHDKASLDVISDYFIEDDDSRLIR